MRLRHRDTAHDGTLTVLIQKARERGDLAAARKWAERMIDPARRAQALQSLNPPR